MPIEPPSKSYNLVLSSSSSSSEDENDKQQRFQRDLASARRKKQQMKDDDEQQRRLSEKRREIELAVAAARARQLEEEEEEKKESLNDEQQSQQQPTTNKTAKNRKRRANRKKKQKAAKQRAASSSSSGATTTTKKRVVSFDSTQLWEFDRTIETCTGVPADGGWPLGMEWKDIGNHYAKEQQQQQVDKPKRIPDPIVLPIDDYESAKQDRLRIRWEKLKENKDSPVAPLRKTEDGPFETRQLDYVRGVSNPLFRPLLEDERRHLILEGEVPEKKSSSRGAQKNGHHGSIRRQRSNSFGSNNHNNSHDNGHTSRVTRSNSLNQSTSRWSSVDIRHIRNELEDLRVHRTTEGSSGCTCRKLHVYLMPSDGSGGKKAQHKRLKPAKLVDELRKRHELPQNHTKMKREELERLLHDVVEQEGCCASADCECRRNGLQCSSDACSCWYDSHQAKDHPNTGNCPSSNEIKKRCGNGIYVVNTQEISSYRQNLLCQVVED